jgi:FkbM family methyltransferase
MKKNIIRTALLLFNLGFLKFIIFKIKCYLPGDIKTLKFKNQKFYIRKNTSDFEVFRQIFASKQYNVKGLSGEQVEYIIDLGSNNGMSAAYFKMQYPKAKLIGVDPDLDNIAIAKKNTELFSDVVFEHKAIWYEETNLDIFDTGKGAYSYNVVSIGNKINTIKTTTIPSLIKKYNFPRIDILKVDIEGAEIELFKNGDLSWLSNVKCLLVECHDHKRKGCTETLFKSIYPYSFTVGFKGETFVILFN